MNVPNRLDFTSEEVDALLDRLSKQCLQEGDYSLLMEILKAMVWLSFSLQEKELSIKRLRKVFGIKTESAKKLLDLVKKKSKAKPDESKKDSQNPSGENEDLKSNENNKSEKEEADQSKNSSGLDPEEDDVDDLDQQAKGNNSESEGDNPEKKKNHGHRASSDFIEAKVIPISHQALKNRDRCPDCPKGKLFNLKPGIVLRIVGQPWLQVEIYHPERLRCSVCGKVFTANLPEGICNQSRVDISAKAVVSLLKYRGGVPFYRQGQIQEILGTPISASEIWEMTEDVANAIQPIYVVLCKEASEAELLHNDDTSAKILSRMKDLKDTEDAERTGTFTSCILAELKAIQVRICLFFTGWKHAGENLDELLNKRSKGSSPPIQQCDSLSRNLPNNHKTQLSNCLAHLRRKFYELVDVWSQEVTRIIREFAILFDNENNAPENPEERLKWHQEKSAPVMNRIKDYCNSLITDKKIEPNSSMGKAISYLNNHWEAFTLFLRIPGVPLSNNISEQMIKRVVLNRKNAYFFRNETGAKIADILMSTIETCVLNDANPYNYLIAIQKYQKDVRQNPRLWLPWVYETRLQELCLNNDCGERPYK